MRCPFCHCVTTSVKQTTRPLDEGLAQGDVKRRLRKCRSCDKNFSTFEVHESFFRAAQPDHKLERQPLLMESTKDTKSKPIEKWRKASKNAEKK